jgi:hypothetical protein
MANQSNTGFSLGKIVVGGGRTATMLSSGLSIGSYHRIT